MQGTKLDERTKDWWQRYPELMVAEAGAVLVQQAWLRYVLYPVVCAVNEVTESARDCRHHPVVQLAVCAGQ